MTLKQKKFTIPASGSIKLQTNERIRSLIVTNVGSANMSLYLGGSNENPDGITLPPSTSINLTVFDLFADNMHVIEATGTAADTIDFIWIEGQSGLDAFLLALMGRRR